jgi:hypothetical protein
MFPQNPLPGNCKKKVVEQSAPFLNVSHLQAIDIGPWQFRTWQRPQFSVIDGSAPRPLLGGWNWKGRVSPSLLLHNGRFEYLRQHILEEVVTASRVPLQFSLTGTLGVPYEDCV